MRIPRLIRKFVKDITDVFYFSKRFKKMYRVPPKEFIVRIST